LVFYVIYNVLLRCWWKMNVFCRGSRFVILNPFVLACDEHMGIESPKHERRCPLVKEGVTTGVLLNNKCF